MNEMILKGVAAAPGIAAGFAFILGKQDFIVPPRAIMEKEIPIEIARFEEALIKTREEILTIQKKIAIDVANTLLPNKPNTPESSTLGLESIEQSFNPFLLDTFSCIEDTNSKYS